MTSLPLADGGPTSTDLSAVAEPQPLARRTVLAGALGLAGTAVVGAPLAEAVSVGSHVRETYHAAGGAHVLGAPRRREVTKRIAHEDTYGQRFKRGTVWWGSGVGLVDRPASRVRLPTAPNFRPVMGVTDVWRTGDLDGCSALEKRVVGDLGIKTMIAMNSGDEPAIPGVKSYRYPISNAGDVFEFYRGYVTREASRAGFGKVLHRVARSHAPVLVHCHAGKDRTGWVCDLMQAVAGVDLQVRNLDYLATRSYSRAQAELDWLQAARDALKSQYGTVAKYLVDGCGLSRSDLKRLAKRLR